MGIIKLKNGKVATKARRAMLDEAILANVRKYPFNIKKALELSASQTGMKFCTASYRWYGSKTTPNIKGLKQSQPQFMIVTADGMQYNSKIAQVVKQTKKNLQLDRDLMNLGDITSEQKIEFFDMIFKG